MTIGECPTPNQACPYYLRPPRTPSAEHGCFSDTDHIVPQRLANTVLEKLFIYSPENKQQICRSEHEDKTFSGDEALPDREEMLERVRRQIKAGGLVVRRTIKRKALKGTI